MPVFWRIPKLQANLIPNLQITDLQIKLKTPNYFRNSFLIGLYILYLCKVWLDSTLYSYNSLFILVLRHEHVQYQNLEFEWKDVEFWMPPRKYAVRNSNKNRDSEINMDSVIMQ